MKIEAGIYAVGLVQSFYSEPWANDKTKFNHRLVLRRDYNDRHGNPACDYENIDIAAEDVQRVQEFASSNKDKKVMVPIVKQARAGGKQGAWMSTYMPKGMGIHIL